MAVAELGAGHGVPTIRRTSEMLMDLFGARLVGVDPRDAEVAGGQICIGMGAMETLVAMRAILK
jgi:hypothetical protein